MHSLYLLRQKIIDELALDPETISTFVQSGKSRNHYEKKDDTPNYHFIFEYSGVLIILGYAHPAEHIFWVVGQWLHEHYPSHSPTAIEFDAEIIDSNSTDLKITITGLKDTYKPSINDDGVTIIHCANHPADPVIISTGLKKDGLVLDELITDKCKIGERKK